MLNFPSLVGIWSFPRLILKIINTLSYMRLSQYFSLNIDLFFIELFEFNFLQLWWWWRSVSLHLLFRMNLYQRKNKRVKSFHWSKVAQIFQVSIFGSKLFIRKSFLLRVPVSCWVGKNWTWVYLLLQRKYKKLLQN